MGYFGVGFGVRVTLRVGAKKYSAFSRFFAPTRAKPTRCKLIKPPKGESGIGGGLAGWAGWLASLAGLAGLAGEG